MKIGVLGTGNVGHAIAGRFIELGHMVMMGSRTADNEKAVEWAAKTGKNASAGDFKQTAVFGEILVLCLNGAATVEALEMAGTDNFKGKIVIDITNPLDFSKGMPPTLFVCNTDSLGEQVQKTLPGAMVVKTLNIVTADVMVNPALVPGEIDMLLCGDDENAKAKTTEILRSFGWKSMIDLGSIQSARHMESFVLLWVNLWQKFGDPYFGIRFIKK